MSLNAITYACMMRYLMDGEYTRNEVAVKTGLHNVTACRYIDWLHRKRVVRICTWKRNPINNNWIPVFTLNSEDEADIPKPRNKPKSQVDRDYHARKKHRQMMHLMSGAIDG